MVCVLLTRHIKAVRTRRPEKPDECHLVRLYFMGYHYINVGGALTIFYEWIIYDTQSKDCSNDRTCQRK